MVFDEETCDDLNLFDADPDANCLFNLCNRCRTEGGEKVLHRRMRFPSASAEDLTRTQAALDFVLANREAFRELPPGYVAGNVDQYSRDGMPVVTQEKTVEFTLAAFSIWANEDRFYIRITKGVALTCRLIRSLRRLLTALEPATEQDNNELAPLLDEMRTLLEIPALAAIAPEEEEKRFRKTLRLDQVFRLHNKTAMNRLLQLIYEIDALVSLADATKEHGFNMPVIASGEAHISGEGLHHPFLTAAVENPVTLNSNQRVLFLTGPNMAGKTTYLRTVATALYLAHLGMGVPARRFNFTPVERMLTSLSLSDDLNEGISYFRAEALRVRAVAQSLADGHRVVAIMDEPFKGTNVKDAFDASLAILQRFARRKNSLFMVASHLIELNDQLADDLAIDYRYFEARETRDRLEFDYQLHTGVSSQRLGMRVLSEEGIFELLDRPEQSS